MPPFHWTLARAFLATAETGALSAAECLLGRAQPMIGRQVAALERALGIVLFDRAGRGLMQGRTACIGWAARAAGRIYTSLRVRLV